MAVQNLVTTFPLYSRDIDCSHNRHWCSGGRYFVQTAPLIRLPPWIIKDPGIGTVAVWVNNRKTGTWLDITNRVTTAQTTIDTILYLSYNWLDMDVASNNGHYQTKGAGLLGVLSYTNFVAGCAELQIVIDKGTTSWYSELYYVLDGLSEDHSGASPDNKSGAVLFDFTDDVQVGDIPYSSLTWGQRVFLSCDIGRPTYINTLEGTADGNRESSNSFRKSVKTWATVIDLPEYMLDALALMGIHQTKIVDDQYNISTQIEDVTITPDWSLSDCQARTTIAFTRGFTRKLNC